MLLLGIYLSVLVDVLRVKFKPMICCDISTVCCKGKRVCVMIVITQW